MVAERSLGGLALALATALAFGSPAEAQSAQRAHALYESADFDAARAEADAVVASSTATRDELIEALRVLVALESMTGSPDALAERARSLAALDPQALPAEGAPESAAEAVRVARASEPVIVQIDREGPHVVARALRAPSVARELVLRCEDGSGTHGNTALPSAEAVVELEGDGEAACTAELRTAGAIVLASSSHGERATVGPSEGEGSRLDRDLPWILLGVGAALLVGGVVIGVVVGTSNATPTFGGPVVIGW